MLVPGENAGISIFSVFPTMFSKGPLLEVILPREFVVKTEELNPLLQRQSSNVY